LTGVLPSELTGTRVHSIVFTPFRLKGRFTSHSYIWLMGISHSGYDAI
jgi:hypothetical protein